jgi:hypothetical protein
MTNKERPTVPMTERALIQRINRKLRQEDQVFKTTRGARWRSNLGNYYILDVNRNFILAYHCTPERTGRELGVLAALEHVAEEG